MTLLTRLEDSEPFDRVFDAWFRGAPRPRLEARVSPPAEGGESASPRPAAEGELLGAEPGGRSGLEASGVEVASRKAFPRTGEDARHVLEQIRRALPRDLPLVRSHRLRRARGGTRLDLPRVCREANRTGGEVVRLHWRQRPLRTRPVLLLVDVSGSMKQHSPDLLRLAHAVVAAVPRVEVFTFGTRLTPGYGAAARARRRPGARGSREDRPRRRRRNPDRQRARRAPRHRPSPAAHSRGARDRPLGRARARRLRADGRRRSPPRAARPPSRLVVAACVQPGLPAGHAGDGGGASQPRRPHRGPRPRLGPRGRAQTSPRRRRVERKSRAGVGTVRRQGARLTVAPSAMALAPRPSAWHCIFQSWRLRPRRCAWHWLLWSCRLRAVALCLALAVLVVALAPTA